MVFNDKNVASSKEVLKRRLGGELIVPVTLSASALSASSLAVAGVVRAGTPLTRQGAIANDATAEGILLNDVTTANPNGALVVAFATINTANAESNTGLTIADAAKLACSKLVFE